MTGLVEVKPGDAGYAHLRNWLEDAALTTSDLAEGGARYFALNDANGHPLAFAGLAGEPPDLLLRSVVVQAAVRRSGVGARLITSLEGEARARKACALWLLTEDAVPFFTRLGFTPVERASAPPSIAGSAQFQKLCPASAALMHKRLHGDTA